MRWQRIALWTTLGGLAVVAVLVSWLWIADLGVFRPQVERFVAEKLGRDFAVDGGFHVDLARHSSVIAEDVRFGNTNWAEPDNMVTVGRVELRVDLWSLVRGPVLIELIKVDDAAIFLVNPGDREPNWVLPVNAAIQEEVIEDTPDLDIIVTQIEMERVSVVLDSVERERPLHLDVERLQQTHREDNFLDLELRGTLDGRLITIDGEVGSWDALLAGKDVDFAGEATLDTFELSAHGHVDDVANLTRPEFEFTAHGPDVDDLTRLLGIGEEGEGDINISGALTRRDDSQMVLTIEGNMGQTEISASGSVADLQSFDNIQLKATSTSPDLGRILRLAGIHQVRESPFVLKLDAETRGGTLFINEADVRFAEARFDASGQMPRFPSIEGAILNVQIAGPRIERFRDITGIPGVASGPFSIGLTVDVRDAGVQGLNLNAKTSLGEIRVDGITGRFEGRLPLSQGIRGTDLTFDVHGPNLAQLVGAFAATNTVPALGYAAKGRMQVQSEGIRFRSVTGSLGSSAIHADGLLVLEPGLAGTYLNVGATGEAFEELIEPFGDLAVRPGPYELAGRITFKTDAINLSKVILDRATGDVRLNLEIGLPVSDNRLDFDIQANGRDVRSVFHGIATFEALEQTFSADVTGKLRDHVWTFDQLDVTVGDATIQASGDLELGDVTDRTAFDLALDVPSLARLGTLDGRNFNDQGFAVTAHAAAGNGVLEVDDFGVRIGGSDVGGRVKIEKGEVPEVTVDLFSDKLVILPLLVEAEGEYDPEPAFSDGRLIPDIDIPFEAIARLNTTINVEVGELQRGTLSMSDVELDMTVRDGVLNISNARYKGRSGEMMATASLDPADGAGAVSLQLVARDFALGMTEANTDSMMIGDIDIDLHSTGANARTLAGNSSGVIFINTRGGRLTNNAFIQAIYGDMLEEILSTINPFKKTDPHTNFECLILPIAITDGQVTSAPNAFIGTDKMRISSKASLNLKTEEIRIGVRTTPRRRVSSISAAELMNPFVQVVGTLASPRLAVDESGVLMTGGVAAATGGLSLLAKGMWDRLSKSKNPCKQISDQAIEALGSRFPDLVIEGVSRLE